MEIPRHRGSRFFLRCLLSSLLAAGLARAEGVWVEGSSQPYERITISSPVEDFVGRVLVAEGDTVEAGQILGELRLTRARLEVERLDGLITKAEFDFRATEELFRQRIESQERLNERRAELDRLKVEREIARNELEERIFRSPIDGVVVHRLKDPGETIGRVEPLFEVIDASRLKLTFFLPSPYLTVLEAGMEVDVAFPELAARGPYRARLIFLDPQVDARSGLFRARFEFDNREAAIPPGVRVRCRLPEVVQNSLPAAP
jgi:membrane fusion protein, multidrug efflux system